MDALAFLSRAADAKPQPIYVLAGDEEFLRRRLLPALQTVVLGDADPAFARSNYAADAEWAAVRAELETLPFLRPRRLVVVENADPFVTRYRAQLEKYVGKPAAAGTLVLGVKSWPKTTKLSKLVPDTMTLLCTAPKAQQLPPWCREWCRSQYGKELATDASQWLVELVGAEMGLLDSELAKIAAAVGSAARVSKADIDRLAGRTRQAETFKIFDAIGAGRPGDALTMLHRLYDQGEDPMALLGAFGWQLRRLAAVARLTIHNKRPLSAAMSEAGVPPFVQRNFEQQIKHLGRRRLEKLFDWLLEADGGMKGGSPLPPRQVLERLVVQLARPRAAELSGGGAAGGRPTATVSPSPPR